MTGTGETDVTVGDTNNTLFVCCCNVDLVEPMTERGLAMFVVSNLTAVVVLGVTEATIGALQSRIQE